MSIHNESEDHIEGTIDDSRLAVFGPKDRCRSGTEQIFSEGGDERDFKRYQAEGGTRRHDVKMHDKPGTVRLQPPRSELYASFYEGQWVWRNGCAECNGRPRDWMTYVECEKHDVCKTCGITREQMPEGMTVWGTKQGWQCDSCHQEEKASTRREALLQVALDDFEVDCEYTDDVICPHCASKLGDPSEPPSDGEEMSCGVCGGNLEVEVIVSYNYTTTIVGEREQL